VLVFWHDFKDLKMNENQDVWSFVLEVFGQEFLGRVIEVLGSEIGWFFGRVVSEESADVLC